MVLEALPAMGISEIAALAKVSKSTVSRALAGKGSMRPETRQRIVSIAKQMGYQPQAAARALVRGRQNLVGLVCERGYRGGRDWILDIMGGLLAHLENHDYHAVVFQREPDEDAVPPMALSGLVDGMVLALWGNVHFAQELLARGMPVVLAKPKAPSGCSAVRTDEVGAMRLAVKHLLGLGHRRIAYVASPLSLSEGIIRVQWDTFVETMSEAGLPPNPGGREIGEAPELLDRVFQRGGATGLVCFNDNTAIAVIRELKSRGLDVPTNVSVVGMDDISYASSFIPALTTARLPHRDVGVKAGEMILEMIELPDCPRRQVVLPAELVVRESTAAPAVSPTDSRKQACL